MQKTNIILTPYHSLIWQFPSDLSGIKTQNWRQSLFQLSALYPKTFAPVPAFWQDFSHYFVHALCHLPVDTKNDLESLFILLPPPSKETCQKWLDNAPPMDGGEYLSRETFLSLWNSLIDWCKEHIAHISHFSPWLEENAPRWKQVGRVTFNLAENKGDANHPFAFMATYTEGLNQEGKAKHLPLGNALKQYADAKNRSALIRLLSPVQSASELLPWVQDLVETKSIYRPIAFTVERAYRLLKDAPLLEQAGISLRLPPWWQKRQRPRALIRVGENKIKGVGVDALVSFNVSMALGETLLSEEDIAFLLQSNEKLLFFKGQWIEVDKEKLQQVMEYWNLGKSAIREGSMSFGDAMRLLAGIPNEAETNNNDLFDDIEWQSIEAGNELHNTLNLLRNPSNLSQDRQPLGVNATLRPYQREGLMWLRFITGLGLGACLADDMGLGKTLQILALLMGDTTQKTSTPLSPSLLVIPASLLGNWRSEAEKFTPSLRLAFLHLAETKKNVLDEWLKKPDTLQNFDVVVTTYSMLTRHDAVLSSVQWNRFILDEAQAIKNPDTKQARAARRIQAKSRIALTGTPIENRLSDVWSLFHCINPGLLGSAKTFQKMISHLETRKQNQYAPLKKLLSPYIMRRMKTDKNIISDLPDKTEITQYCNLSKEQVKLYQEIIALLKATLNEISDTEESAIRRKGIVLQTLTRLKQVCNHPAQLLGSGAFNPSESGKFLRLGELCQEMAERQERVLIFTQYQEIIEPLSVYLTTIFQRSGLILHGKIPVKKRKELVELFQRPDGPPYFLISLKAGGTGLNLTAASQVIHFDRWWNPAVENQATDRAFRIGQEQPVFVHKFVVRGTLEERIDTILQEKKKLSNDILSGSDEINITNLSDKDLLNMLSLDISKALG